MRWLFEEARALPSLRIRNAFGSSLLWMACWRGHLEICKWLHGVPDDAGGCSLDAASSNNYGQTPMLRACLSGHLEVCHWLYYDAGAVGSVRTPDHDGRTPFGVACWQGHLGVAQWLGSVGCKQDAWCREVKTGSTVFFNACQGGHLEVASWLLAPADAGGCGCAQDVDVATLRGATPLASATIKGHSALCCWLVVHGGANDGGLHVDGPSLANDVPSYPNRCELRSALASYSHDGVVDGGGLDVGTSTASTNRHASTPSRFDHFLTFVESAVGVRKGSPQWCRRNVREAVVCLDKLIAETEEEDTGGVWGCGNGETNEAVEFPHEDGESESDESESESSEESSEKSSEESSEDETTDEEEGGSKNQDDSTSSSDEEEEDGEGITEDEDAALLNPIQVGS